MSYIEDLGHLIQQAKQIAKGYHALTGRPLGITGEVAEFEAVRCLDLEMAPVRQAGYDAVRRIDGREEKIQIKGRCVLSKKSGKRIGSIDLKKEWDFVVLVLLDADLAPMQMYEADRAAVEEALGAPGSKARNERGALSINKFKSIGTIVWDHSL